MSKAMSETIEEKVIALTEEVRQIPIDCAKLVDDLRKEVDDGKIYRLNRGLSWYTVECLRGGYWREMRECGLPATKWGAKWALRRKHGSVALLRLKTEVHYER